MTANLAAFAIHVDDTDRAIAFYEGVFGWTFEPWGPPGFYLIRTGDDASPGIQGLMHKRHEPRIGTGLAYRAAVLTVAVMFVLAALTLRGVPDRSRELAA